MLAVVVLNVLIGCVQEYRAGKAVEALIDRVLLSELARMPITALLIGVPLLASLAWTFGLAYRINGTLNMMTSTLGLVLLGLGIDYGIHFYARYAEERGQQRNVATAVEATFMNTGEALVGTALTTAAAFFLLMLADFRGFSEFGCIALGIGMTLLSALVYLPALLYVLEQHQPTQASSYGDRPNKYEGDALSTYQTVSRTGI